MPVLRPPRSDVASQVTGGLRRVVALAATSALMVTLASCSPEQDGDSAAQEATASAAVGAEATAQQTEEPSDNDADRDPQSTDATDPTAEQTPADTGSVEPNPDATSSPPASFEIPAIDAGSDLLHLGLRENNTLEVPPGDPGSPASWYTGSPVPGDAGPAVLLGHVDDSLGEPGVFADLPALVEGDEITVDQEDGDTATFVVTKAEQYGKNTFPTLEVYGNTEDPELRLITCDGYNEATGEYEDNYVVYATLAG